MQFAIQVPNFGSSGDPRVLVDLARRTEDAGWDGFFVWDHLLVDPSWRLEIADPWIALAAVAQVTARIRLGPMVAALPRRRPSKLARETASLDRLSNGRLILGIGLGWPSEADFGTFGDEVDLARRGAMVDEGLAVLEGLWRGEPFTFEGEHYRVRMATFLPRPVQEPRIPVWVAALRPGSDAPLRRAARWDGFAPAVEDGYLPLEMFARDVARIRELRAAAGMLADAPYEIVAAGATPGDDRAAAGETVAAFEAAGATWWQEIVSDWLGGLDAIRARIAAGPPRP
ncbi:MAG TPA: TIGR03619 family F420-dependent LLM class oxidoreductase [Patescibacteria group bacterium]|nr:TIGR03619 family F420-dependent LLM class oxidoreductase [Patescibacteria group bacterium]